MNLPRDYDVLSSLDLEGNILTCCRCGRQGRGLITVMGWIVGGGLFIY
jgi:hypothetical protein